MCLLHVYLRAPCSALQKLVLLTYFTCCRLSRLYSITPLLHGVTANLDPSLPVACSSCSCSPSRSDARMLPHDARLAGDNALKALSADTSKGAAADLLKGANDAHAAGRLPLALTFARKAAEKLGSAEAKSTYGELLLEAGCVEAARAALEEAHQLAEGKDLGVATGLAMALWHSGAEAGKVSGAVEEAKRAYNSPSTQKGELARLEFALGRLDDAAANPNPNLTPNPRLTLTLTLTLALTVNWAGWTTPRTPPT